MLPSIEKSQSLFSRYVDEIGIRPFSLATSSGDLDLPAVLTTSQMCSKGVDGPTFPPFPSMKKGKRFCLWSDMFERCG